MKTVTIADITIEKSPKVRASQNQATVEEYSERYLKKQEMPPVVLFESGSELLLADGLHRCLGAKQAGLLEINAEIRKGGYQDALQFALVANAKHGLPRTHADKRTCIESAIIEWPKSTDSQIAMMCDVSNHLVAIVRGDLEAESKVEPEPVRIDAKGRKVPAKKGPANPPVEVDVDCLGTPIPLGVKQYWERSDEVKTVLNNIKEVENTIYQALELKDVMYAEVNFTSALADLRRALTTIECALPYAVCTLCQGHPETQKTTCRMCLGRGLISKFRYDRTAEEVKRMRGSKK
jgi:hypothetical protein